MSDRRDLLKASLAGVAMSAAPGVADAASPAFAVPAPPVVSLPVIGSAARFPVRRIYCVGRNYLAHRQELGNSTSDPLFFFAKHRDTIVQNGGNCAYPALTKDYQHEVELVVAMKSGGMNIPSANALGHVYGYAVGLDMTRRDQQAAMKVKELPWEIAKSFEDSAPCGAITPVDAVGHLREGRIMLTVNGAVRQDSDLANMMWGVADVISQLSNQAELRAGDLIYTGTPGGVSAVLPGDVIAARIDKLQELTVTVR